MSFFKVIVGRGKTHEGLSRVNKESWGDTRIFLVAENWLKIEMTVWQDTLSWCSTQVFLMIGLTCMTLFTKSQLFSDHPNRQLTIRSDTIPDPVEVFVIFWSQMPSTTRFIFNRLSAFEICLKPPNNLGPLKNTVSIRLLKILKSVHHTVTKSEVITDDTPLIEIVVTYFQNALENPVYKNNPLLSDTWF